MNTAGPYHTINKSIKLKLHQDAEGNQYVSKEIVIDPYIGITNINDLIFGSIVRNNYIAYYPRIENKDNILTIYTPKYDFDLNYVLSINTLNPKHINLLITRLIIAIYILHKNGWIYNNLTM